jgi:ribosomal protein S18 acetylase RimI-like enzyme
LIRRTRPNEIRRAVPDDAGRLARVHVETWREAYRGILPGNYLDSLSVAPRVGWWKRYVGNDAVVHVAEVDAAVVGFCSVGASDLDGWGEVFALYVHPTEWGEGHGRRLIEAGEVSLRDAGFTRALLWVLERNDRARSFYERQGWRMGKPFRVEEIGGAQVSEVRYEILL